MEIAVGSYYATSLSHIFKKKTNKIHKKDLDLAINRLKLYEQ